VENAIEDRIIAGALLKKKKREERADVRRSVMPAKFSAEFFSFLNFHPENYPFSRTESTGRPIGR
jgi:hypothetical protein